MTNRELEKCFPGAACWCKGCEPKRWFAKRGERISVFTALVGIIAWMGPQKTDP